MVYNTPRGDTVFEKIKSLFKGKDDRIETNKRLSKKLHNMHFQYISEKFEDGTEKIIAKGGHINLEGEKGDILCGTLGVKTLFRLDIYEMHIWEFMSLNGCVITFTDLDTGVNRKLSVYYDAHLVRT